MNSVPEMKDRRIGATVQAGEQIRRAALSWPGVSASSGRDDATEFCIGTREIGHIHGNTVVHIRFPRQVRDELVAARLAEPHLYAPKSGWVSFRIKGPADVERAIWLLQRSYGLAVSAPA